MNVGILSSLVHSTHSSASIIGNNPDLVTEATLVARGLGVG